MDNPLGTPSDQHENEVTIMDLAIIVLDKIRWIAAFVVITGLVAVVVVEQLPKTYHSSSIISVEKPLRANQVSVSPGAYQIAAILKSNDLALQVYKTDAKLRNLEEDRALEKIYKRISVSVGRQDKLVTLTTEGDSSHSAQALNIFLLEKMFAQSKPRGPQLDNLSREIRTLEEALANGLQLRDLITKAITNGKPLSDAQATIYADVMRNMPELSAKLSEAQSIRTGLSSSDLVQTPTLPKKPSSPHKLGLLVIALLSSVFLGVLLVLLGHYWRHKGRAEYLSRKKALAQEAIV